MTIMMNDLLKDVSIRTGQNFNEPQNMHKIHINQKKYNVHIKN